MVHQCMSENLWFIKMLAIDVEAPPLPAEETRLGFIQRYAEDSGKRLGALREQPESWWAGQTGFFEVERSRAWVMTRRIAHSAHHRGQQTAMLRMLGRDLPAPTARQRTPVVCPLTTRQRCMPTITWTLSSKAKPPVAPRPPYPVLAITRSPNAPTQRKAEFHARTAAPQRTPTDQYRRGRP